MPGFSEAANLRHNGSQTIAVGAASVQSTAWGAQTYAIRVSTTIACHIEIGVSPVATSASALLPTNWVEYILVSPGQKLAVIQDAATGNMTVTELTT